MTFDEETEFQHDNSHAMTCPARRYEGDCFCSAPPLIPPGMVECPRCLRPMSEHHRDPIGAGLVQYACPEASE